MLLLFSLLTGSSLAQTLNLGVIALPAYSFANNYTLNLIASMA